VTNSTAQHSTAQLRLRPASLDDAELLLEWRNDLSTREASHNTAPICIDEHIEWLKRILANENRHLYVAEIDGAPVGTVRADYENPGYELSWTVSPSMRGHGVGKDMVRLLAKTISDSIRAEVKAGNIASIRIAEAAGMVFEREESGILHYRRGAVAQHCAPRDAAR
jgi:RimJ/RimL family protein N-acetyltransferase